MIDNELLNVQFVCFSQIVFTANFIDQFEIVFIRFWFLNVFSCIGNFWKQYFETSWMDTSLSRNICFIHNKIFLTKFDVVSWFKLHMSSLSPPSLLLYNSIIDNTRTNSNGSCCCKQSSVLVHPFCTWTFKTINSIRSCTQTCKSLSLKNLPWFQSILPPKSMP